MAETFKAVPFYRTLGGQQIFAATAFHKSARPVPLTELPSNIDILLVVHFTESEELDSRAYLQKPNDGRVVSCHYLAGQYPDMHCGQPAVIKYAGETNDRCYTQGFSLLGQLLQYDHSGNDWADGKVSATVVRGPNDVAIGYEIEATREKPPSPELTLAVAAHMAEIIRYWETLGRDVLLIGHRHIDSHKKDPDFSWTKFAKLVYVLV